MPPPQRQPSPQPHVEEAIEIENNDNQTAPEEPKQTSRSSPAFSNKSTASLIRDDGGPEDDGNSAADNPAFDEEDKQPSPPPAYSAASVRSQQPPPPPAEDENPPPVNKSTASIRSKAKSNVSLKNLSPGSPTGDFDLNSSQISVKPLIEDDEESKV